MSKLDEIKTAYIANSGKEDDFEAMDQQDWTECFKTWFAATEKQIPKSPNFEGDGCDTDGNIIYDIWLCPNCEAYFEVDYDDYDYCPNCGQKLGLSDVN